MKFKAKLSWCLSVQPFGDEWQFMRRDRAGLWRAIAPRKRIAILEYLLRREIRNIDSDSYTRWQLTQ